MTRMNTTEANVTPFPGYGPARRALSDPKTSDEIRALAADMVGDVARHDITMMARGADWTEPPPRVRYRPVEYNHRLEVALHLALAAIPLALVFGWYLGLLTALYTIN